MAGELPSLDAEWRAAVARVLRGADPETLIHHTLDGIPRLPLYPAAERSACWQARPAGRWRIAQRVDHPDLAEANRLALADLEGGADCLTLVAAETPSAHGFGVHVHDAADLETLLDGVQLDLFALRFDAGARGFELADRLAELAERRGQDLAQLDLDLGVDPVGILATAGALPADWGSVAGHLAGSIDRLKARGFAGRALRADGRVWSDAGASAAQELAAVLGSATLHMRALEANGLPLDAARNTLSFTLAADTDLILTVGKMRALRALWTSVEEACGLEARPTRIHAETAWRMFAATASHTNIIRSALACFAAAVGGANSIDVLPFTLPLGLPDAAARQLARNTQHVLADEAQLWRVSDPAAGAGAFEAMTQNLCDAAWQAFQQIEREGGIVHSLVAGEVQRRIAAQRQERRARLADGRDGLIGVTLFRQEQDNRPQVLMPRRPAIMAVAAGPLRAEPLVEERDAEAFESEASPDRDMMPSSGPAHQAASEESRAESS